MAIPVGSKAPDFTLKSKQASGLVDVKLSNNFGKKNTVLLFFPAAFTGVCTQELCDITGGLNAYAGLNADVIAISVDTPFAQEAWAQKEKIGITLASDLNKEVIKKYDVVFPMLAGVGDTAARAAFVIDKSGVVQYSEQTPTPEGSAALRPGQSHAGEAEVGRRPACPGLAGTLSRGSPYSPNALNSARSSSSTSAGSESVCAISSRSNSR